MHSLKDNDAVPSRKTGKATRPNTFVTTSLCETALICLRAQLSRTASNASAEASPSKKAGTLHYRLSKAGGHRSSLNGASSTCLHIASQSHPRLQVQALTAPGPLRRLLRNCARQGPTTYTPKRLRCKADGGKRTEADGSDEELSTASALKLWHMAMVSAFKFFSVSCCPTAPTSICKRHLSMLELAVH